MKIRSKYVTLSIIFSTICYDLWNEWGRPVTNTYFTIRIFDHQTIRIIEYLKLGQKHTKKTAGRHCLKIVTALSHWDISSSRSAFQCKMYAMRCDPTSAWNSINNRQKKKKIMFYNTHVRNLPCSAPCIIMFSFFFFLLRFILYW